MRRIIGILLILGLLCGLCGCSTLTAGPDSLLRPPLTGSEQAAIQQALGDYISRTAGTEDYVLKYPKTGAYLSAFVLQDMDGDGAKEAICFYRINRQNENVHVNLLKKTRDGWQSVSDVMGDGAELEWVAFGDPQGDGRLALLIGWNVYSNNRDRQLVMYTLEQQSLTARYRAICSAVAVGDITASGRDTLLLFSIDNATHSVTASLFGMEEDGVAQFGSVALDNGITEFGEARVCTLSDGVNGVFIDAYKDNNQVITELIYWEGRQLLAPFVDATRGQNELTAREAPRQSLIASTDVDGDGVPEWPRTRRLNGYETAELGRALFLTTWMKWNYATKTVEPLFDCIVNDTDGYYLRLDPALVGATLSEDRVSARYTAATHTFELCAVENGLPGRPLLALAPQNAAYAGAEAGWEQFQLMLADGSTYTVWYTTEEDYRFTEERIRYLVTVLH